MFEVDAIKVAVGTTPDPEVAALSKRWQFSEAYQRRIVRAANACQVARSVRYCAERLYSSPAHALVS